MLNPTFLILLIFVNLSWSLPSAPIQLDIKVKCSLQESRNIGWSYKFDLREMDNIHHDLVYYGKQRWLTELQTNVLYEGQELPGDGFMDNKFEFQITGSHNCTTDHKFVDVKFDYPQISIYAKDLILTIDMDLLDKSGDQGVINTYKFH